MYGSGAGDYILAFSLPESKFSFSEDPEVSLGDTAPGSTFENIREGETISATLRVTEHAFSITHATHGTIRFP